MSEINKTIVVSYDEVSRMKDFCCHEGAVSKDFLDWYLKEDAFFTKTGMLIVENVFEDEKVKYCLSFDFNNPNVSLFNLYNYETQKCVSKFRFVKEQNLTMSKISIILNDFDKKYFKENKLNFYNFKDGAVKTDIITHLKSKSKHSNKGKNTDSMSQLLKKKSRIETKLDDVNKSICSTVCIAGVYFCYATMYYFAKNKPKEIGVKRRDSIISEGLNKQVMVTYKYSGYVNIEHKIYKTTIKRPEGEEARKYGRHIEKWSVRGHYRRINGNLVWINSHERGEGELEKRIYGTADESEVNVIPKVFHVERNVADVEKNSDIIREIPLSAPVEGVQKMTPIYDKPIENKKSEKQNIIIRILNTFKKWKSKLLN